MRKLALLAVVIMGLGAASMLFADDVFRPTTGEEKLLGGFEGETVPREWEPNADTKLSISTEHATEGKQSLKVEMSKGAYPGVGLVGRAQDWSTYDALRFTVFNQNAGTVWCTVRVDDATSRGIGSRFSMDDHVVAIRINNGVNDIEVPICALKQGTPESQGLDATRIKQFKFFIGDLKRDAVLFFDNVRLVREERKAPDVLPIADFDKPPGKITAGAGAVVTEVDNPSGKDGKCAKIDLSPEADYPSVYITAPADWLSYDLVCIDIFCPEAVATPNNLAFKVTDSTGRGQTFCTGLVKGMNEVCIPMEALSFLSPGRVKDFSLFWSKLNANMTVYVDNVRLERAKLADYPTRHAVGAAADKFLIDYTAIPRGKNTCYMATTWVPLKAGGYRVVRCNSPDKKQLSYGIDADAFKDADEKKPVRVWTMFLDHGVWSLCEAFVPLKKDGQTKFSLDDAMRFGN